MLKAQRESIDEVNKHIIDELTKELLFSKKD